MNPIQQKIILAYLDAYNNFDIEGMLKDLHEEVRFQNVSNGKVDLNLEGIDAFQKQAASAKELFSQRRQSVTNWHFEEGKVTIDIDYQGTLAVDLPNGLEAGQSLELKGQSEFVFDGSRIVSITDKS